MQDTYIVIAFMVAIVIGGAVGGSVYTAIEKRIRKRAHYKRLEKDNVRLRCKSEFYRLQYDLSNDTALCGYRI